ncbi:hypothetical protein [Nonomuraea zeae]|uniref:Uncharacterized protein n=1 Tax=Nonomuraea zeae TaxID=1642303 RepID=A0A5S4H1A1_9ACTN|nr:hypothetical protein [Nonomuraea zeae]TMR39003.1 hypothetical protein ETD85_02675 [Nonomuraea zeae]
MDTTGATVLSRFSALLLRSPTHRWTPKRVPGGRGGGLPHHAADQQAGGHRPQRPGSAGHHDQLGGHLKLEQHVLTALPGDLLDLAGRRVPEDPPAGERPGRSEGEEREVQVAGDPDLERHVVQMVFRADLLEHLVAVPGDGRVAEAQGAGGEAVPALDPEDGAVVVAGPASVRAQLGGRILAEAVDDVRDPVAAGADLAVRQCPQVRARHAGHGRHGLARVGRRVASDEMDAAVAHACPPRRPAGTEQGSRVPRSSIFRRTGAA